MFYLIFNKNSLIRRNFGNVMSKKNKARLAQKDKDASTKITKEEDGPLSLDKSNNIIISILAKPGAKQNSVTSISAEGVGVQINAPPSEGEANTELVRYMAAVLGLRKSDVFLDKGFKSRIKTLKITGNISLEEAKTKLLKEMQNS